MSSKLRRAAKITGGIVAGFLLLGVGAAIGTEDPAGTPAPAAEPPPTTITETVTVNAPPSTVKAKPTTVTVVKTKTKTVTQQAPEALAPEQPDVGSVYYGNCSEARAAGDTPLYRGDPGYASHLDRDDDGVACE